MKLPGKGRVRTIRKLRVGIVGIRKVGGEGREEGLEVRRRVLNRLRKFISIL